MAAYKVIHDSPESAVKNSMNYRNLQVPYDTISDVVTLADAGIARICHQLKLFPHSFFSQKSLEGVLCFSENVSSNETIHEQIQKTPSIAESDNHKEYNDLSPLTLTMALEDPTSTTTSISTKTRDGPSYNKMKHDESTNKSSSFDHKLRFSRNIDMSSSVLASGRNDDLEKIRAYLHKCIECVLNNGIMIQIIFDVCLLHDENNLSSCKEDNKSFVFDFIEHSIGDDTNDKLQEKVHKVAEKLSMLYGGCYNEVYKKSKSISSTTCQHQNGWNSVDLYLDYNKCSRLRISIEISYIPLSFFDILKMNSLYDGLSFEKKSLESLKEEKDCQNKSAISRMNKPLIHDWNEKKDNLFEFVTHLLEYDSLHDNSNSLAIPYGLSRRDKLYMHYRQCIILSSKVEKDGRYFKVAFKCKRLIRHGMKKQWIRFDRVMCVRNILTNILHMLSLGSQKDNIYLGFRACFKRGTFSNRNLAGRIGRDLCIEEEAIMKVFRFLKRSVKRIIEVSKSKEKDALRNLGTQDTEAKHNENQSKEKGFSNNISKQRSNILTSLDFNRHSSIIVHPVLFLHSQAMTRK